MGIVRAPLYAGAVFCGIVTLFVTLSMPQAATALGDQANQMCLPVVIPDPCGCGKITTEDGCQPHPNRFLCYCWDDTHDFKTYGQCFKTGECKAFGNSDGTFDPGQELLNQALQQASQLLQSGQPSGVPENPGQQTYGAPFDSGYCVGGYFQTSDISELSNPCAQYVPNVSGGITTGGPSTCDPISQLMGRCGASPPIIVPTSSGTPQIRPGTTTLRRVIFQPNLGGLTGPTAGLRGDIVTRVRDATVLAGSRDPGANVEVAGFFGSQTFGTQQPRGLVARWCETRPWATNFISKIVTPSFFDNLCTSRGYRVGLATSTPQVTLVQKSPTTKPATTTPRAATSTPSVPPRVDIWASPASVPLGGRTSIFWNSQGVESCRETASDGNFYQQSLSGGAATVPITEAVTFTITCEVSDGTTVTASTVVGLSI